MSTWFSPSTKGDIECLLRRLWFLLSVHLLLLPNNALYYFYSFSRVCTKAHIWISNEQPVSYSGFNCILMNQLTSYGGVIDITWTCLVFWSHLVHFSFQFKRHCPQITLHTCLSFSQNIAEVLKSKKIRHSPHLLKGYNSICTHFQIKSYDSNGIVFVDLSSMTFALHGQKLQLHYKLCMCLNVNFNSFISCFYI